MLRLIVRPTTRAICKTHHDYSSAWVLNIYYVFSSYSYLLPLFYTRYLSLSLVHLNINVCTYICILIHVLLTLRLTVFFFSVCFTRTNAAHFNPVYVKPRSEFWHSQKTKTKKKTVTGWKILCEKERRMLMISLWFPTSTNARFVSGTKYERNNSWPMYNRFYTARVSL